MGPIGLQELVVFLLIVVALVVPACMICKKAGYSPWWGVVVLIPIGNVIWLWYLGLADWPATRKGSTT